MTQGNNSFKDAQNIFHLVKDHSDSERKKKMLPPHGLLFPISSRGYFIWIVTHTG